MYFFKSFQIYQYTPINTPLNYLKKTQKPNAQTGLRILFKIKTNNNLKAQIVNL